MNRFFCKIALVALMIVAAVGCAQKPEGDFDALEAQSLAAWMDKNYPDWKTSGEWTAVDGVYIQWLRKVAESATDTIVKPENWVRINYTGKNLQDDVFYTRNAKVAKVQGTFSRRTHYVPDFVYLSEENTLIHSGTYEALTRMKVGEMVRVVIPSGRYSGSNGYSSTNVGYNGQFGLAGNVPLIIDSLELVEVSADPIVTENKEIAAYVKDRWAMKPADSLKEGLYFQLMTPLPFRRDSVAKDSTLTCYYKAYFLDGFVFDSNIDSVQMRAWGEITNQGPLKWDMSDKSTSMISGFKEACLQACYGDHFRTVFTSAWGYGISGSAAKATTISSSSNSSYDEYANYYNYLNYYNYMNQMYGYGSYGYGGYGYGNSYYNNYYNSAYYASLYSSMYNQQSSQPSNEDETEESKVQISTEILPFTPLIFEIWVCANDGSETTPEHNKE
ncbi:MAG: hypothetical protein IIX81_01135 [Tidjanibacter sp.]|nr:hypothetical protein [Tidjanibacter sp.]